MAKINRSDVIQKAVNDLALSTAEDKIPTETLDKIQLTYDLNKKFSSFVISNSRATTGTLTLTMPSLQDRQEIFITSLDFDFIKDAACDAATANQSITLTPLYNGISSVFLNYNFITLTAQSGHIHIEMSYPLKLSPNSNIFNAATFSLGVLLRSISVTGFITSSN